MSRELHVCFRILNPILSELRRPLNPWFYVRTRIGDAWLCNDEIEPDLLTQAHVTRWTTQPAVSVPNNQKTKFKRANLDFISAESPPSASSGTLHQNGAPPLPRWTATSISPSSATLCRARVSISEILPFPTPRGRVFFRVILLLYEQPRLAKTRKAPKTVSLGNHLNEI